MRRVILFMTMSLDGFIGGPKGELDWEDRDPEVGETLIPELLATVDAMLLGRVLYQGFQQAWPAMASNPSSPKSLVDFAHWIESTPKVVFSKTLEKVEWQNSRLVSVKDDDDITQEVEDLKQQLGGDMVVFGGARLAQTLSRLGLVDEYRLKLQPVALGSGLPLFNDPKGRMGMKLMKCQAFKSGVVALYYQPKRPDRGPAAEDAQPNS